MIFLRLAVFMLGLSIGARRPARAITVDSLYVLVADLQAAVAKIEERVYALDRLTDAKFVTHGTLVTAQERQVGIAMQASQTAIDKTERGAEKSANALAMDVERRFEALNQRYHEHSNMILAAIPRAEFDQFRQMYTEQHTILRDRYAEEISDLKAAIKAAEARSGGLKDAWGVLIGVVGVAVAIGALVFRNMG